MNGASAEAVDVFLQAIAVGVAETIGVHTAEGNQWKATWRMDI